MDRFEIPPARHPARRSVLERLLLLAPSVTMGLLGLLSRLPVGFPGRRFALKRLYQRAYAALSRGDWQASVHLFYTPDARLRQPDNLPGLAGEYVGHDAIEQMLDTWVEVFQDFRVVPREVWDAGDTRVVCVELGATGAGSGVGVQGELFQVQWFDGARIERQINSWDRDEVMRAAGIDSDRLPD